MLKAKQLYVAKTALDAFLSVASNKRIMQVVRLNGSNSTIFAAATGTVVIDWAVSRVSSKIPNTCEVYPVPLDWNNAEEKLGALISDNNHDMPADKELALNVVEDVSMRTRCGTPVEQFIEVHRDYNLVVSSGPTFFFVRSKKEPGQKAEWASSEAHLCNTVFSLESLHFDLLRRIYSEDEDAVMNVTRHKSGAVLFHVYAPSLKVTVNMCAKSTKGLDGKIVWLSKEVHTSEVNNGTFERIMLKEDYAKMSVKGVSITDLLNASGDVKKSEPVEAKETEGLVKPVASEEAPWDKSQDEIPAPPIVGDSVTKKVKLADSVTVEEYQARSEEAKAEEAKAEEAVKSVPELIDDILLQIDEFQTAPLGDVFSRLKLLKAAVKAVAKRYKSESKTIRRSAEDTKKIEDYDNMATQLAKLKKILSA